MRRTAIGVLAASILAVGCTDEHAVLNAPKPAFEISDAAHSGGKPHFFFLPPMVPSPATTGTFDPSLSPEVQICQLDGTSCDHIIAVFTADPGGWGSETVRVSSEDSLYIVNWHTGDFTLDAQATYRIRVLVAGIELGFADVDVVNSGSSLKNVNTNEYIPLLDGRTLPIKFRIETGFVARVEVTPADTTINVAETQQFTATLTDLHGATVSGPAVQWASFDASVATVDQNGLASGVAAGSAAITASAAGVQGSGLLTVLNPQPQSATLAMPLDPAWASAVATDVNDNGIVVGYLYPLVGGAGRRRAFRWDGVNPPEVLPTNGATWCEAWGVGSLNTIVGTCLFPSVGGRAVTWTGAGDPVVLPTPTALSMSSAARDIYEDATVMRITGSVNRNYGYTCSFPPCTSVASNPAIWTSTDGLPPTASPAQLAWFGVSISPGGAGYAINASGHVAGQRTTVVPYVCGFQCFNNADVPHPFRYTTGAVDLGVNYIPPYNLGTGNGLGINASDAVVGYVDALYLSGSNATRHLAERWPGGAATRTGIPGVPPVTAAASEARDINDLGWIVGFYGSNAFVWRNGAAPATVLDPLAPGKSASAWGISDPKDGALYVAGSGVTADGHTVAVRWTLVVP